MRLEKHDLDEVFGRLRFEPDRTPDSTDIGHAFAQVARCRDGAIFVGHYAGRSEWERHANGDEVVMVLAGQTTLFVLVDCEEQSVSLAANQVFVVPRGVWHRFETPDEVKILTVTPQPTDHSTQFPG